MCSIRIVQLPPTDVQAPAEGLDYLDISQSRTLPLLIFHVRPGCSDEELLGNEKLVDFVLEVTRLIVRVLQMLLDLSSLPLVWSDNFASAVRWCEGKDTPDSLGPAISPPLLE